MSLKDLDRGDPVEAHLRLYERELAILDSLAAKHNCSRAAVVGALLKDYVDNNEPDLTGKVKSGEPGRPARRR